MTRSIYDIRPWSISPKWSIEKYILKQLLRIFINYLFFLVAWSSLTLALNSDVICTGKIDIVPKCPISTGTYPSFCIIKQPRVFLHPLTHTPEWQSMARLPPAFVGNHNHTWVQSGTVRVKSVLNCHTMWYPRPWFLAGLLDLILFVCYSA